MQIFKKHEKDFRGVVLKNIPTEIHFTPDKPSVIAFVDGTRGSVGCLHCSQPLCMQYDPTSVKCSAVGDFPCDSNTGVCPVGAISWDEAADIPTIDNKLCIKCGACVRNCPVGALYFNDSQVKVSIDIEVEYKIASSADEHSEYMDKLRKTAKTGLMIEESDNLMKHVYNKLNKIKSDVHNIIGRNLLISLNNTCAMRRIGDVYTRMDAIYLSPLNNFGVVEIEFGNDTLSASRGILDDIAVLHTRYGLLKEQIAPLAICLQLANARQGYWQVVKDVHKVEQISIKTVSIGALMILNWGFHAFEPSDSLFYLDYDNTNLREKVVRIIGRSVRISNNFLGILEPEK